MSEKILRWGYLHTSGTLQAKRYFGALDIREAQQSPFVKTIFGPFEANGRYEALEIINKEIQEINEAANRV